MLEGKFANGRIAMQDRAQLGSGGTRPGLQDSLTVGVRRKAIL